MRELYTEYINFLLRAILIKEISFWILASSLYPMDSLCKSFQNCDIYIHSQLSIGMRGSGDEF